MATITVQNLTRNVLSTEVGSLNPAETKSVAMGPMQAYRASEALKSMKDDGLISVLVSEETAKLDLMEMGPQTPLLEATVTVPTASVLALFGTPYELLAAPAAGFMHILDSVIVYKAAGTAYAGVGATEDLTIKYTNAAGLSICNIEATGFVDQTTAQVRFARPFGALATPTDSSITPVPAAALVAHILVGEVTTGTSDLKFKLFYRTVASTL